MNVRGYTRTALLVRSKQKDLFAGNDTARAKHLVNRLNSTLPTREARRQFAAAVDGKHCAVDAMCEVGESFWPIMVVAFYYNRAPVEAFRKAIRFVWVGHWLQLKDVARVEGGCLLRMFRYAAFPVPDTVPDDVTVYRGGTNHSRDRVEDGMSWTLERDAACYIAVGHDAKWPENGGPRVVSRTIKRSSIIFFDQPPYHEAYSEIIATAGSVAQVDGSEREWRERARNWRARYSDWRH